MEADKIKHAWLYRWWLYRLRKKFVKLGYSKVSSKDLWSYLTRFRWKHACPSSYRARILDMKQVTPNDYFTYESLNATIYNVPNLDEMDLDDLW